MIAIKVINIMKDGRHLESLEGVDAPEVLYDLLLKDYRARGIEFIPIKQVNDLPASQEKGG